MLTKSLQVKFLGITIGTILLMSLANIFFVQAFLKRQLTTELLKRGEIIGWEIARDAVTPLLTKNMFELQSLLHDHVDHEDADYMFITGTSGNVLAHTFGAAFPTGFKKLGLLKIFSTQSVTFFHSDRGNIYHFAIPVLKGDVGTVHIGLAADSITKAVNEEISGLSVINISILLLAGLTAVVFVRVLLKPVEHLTGIAEKVRAGDLHQKALLFPRDEIGILAVTFNQMIDKLRGVKEDLEEKVKERTAEIAYANTALEEEVLARARSQQEREKLIKELESKNAELERFTYTVSHDLKSPLITISGFSGLLEKDVFSGDVERIKNDITQIRSAAEKMKDLLDDLLELSRIGRFVNPSVDVSLTKLAKEAMALVQGQIKDGNVQVSILPNLPTAYVDSCRLVEVFQNLIENSVKFMGTQQEPRIEVGAKVEGEEILCWVKDNGIGITPTYHEKIFMLFEKLDPRFEGTGIGLALVKRIIEFHSGRIWVESEGKGKGATFYFTIPQKNIGIDDES